MIHALTRALLVLLAVLLGGCSELLSSPPTDAEEETCRDIGTLYQVVANAPDAGPYATFAAMGDLSVQFQSDELMLRNEGNTGLANAVRFLSSTLDQLSREGQTDLGLVMLENTREPAASIAEEAGC